MTGEVTGAGLPSRVAARVGDFIEASGSRCGGAHPARLRALFLVHAAPLLLAAWALEPYFDRNWPLPDIEPLK
jgi:hypothetical protein